MRSVCPRIRAEWRRFLFPDVSGRLRRNTPQLPDKVERQGLVNAVNHTVTLVAQETPQKPRSQHDLDFGGLGRQLPVTAAAPSARIANRSSPPARSRRRTRSALSTALTDIDTALQQSRSSDQSSGTRPSKDDMKSKIDDLISSEVSNGTLTSDQAEELKGVFRVRPSPTVPAARAVPVAQAVPVARLVRRPAAAVRRRFGVLHGLDEQHVGRHVDRRDPPAVPAGAAAVAVVDVLLRRRAAARRVRRAARTSPRC